MIKELLPQLFRLEIPLPGSPLIAVNSYLIKGPVRSLLIDTGMDRKECLDAAVSGLKQLGVDRNKLDFFITHLHADHIGLVGRLATASSRVFFNKVEVEVFSSVFDRAGKHYQMMLNFFRENGFPELELEEAMAKHPGRRFGGKRDLGFTTLGAGDSVEAGDYSFRCIETPGHSPGHLCLYEPGKKILVSGDHVLLEITPNITLWQEMTDPLKEYLASLDKVSKLEVSLVLPGHGSIFKDHRQRIKEIQAHHKDRLDEAISALRDGARTAYEVAPHLTWDIQLNSWADLPAQQKWFAFGETMAHLRYLERRGMVRTEKQGDKVVFLLP